MQQNKQALHSPVMRCFDSGGPLVVFTTFETKYPLHARHKAEGEGAFIEVPEDFASLKTTRVRLYCLESWREGSKLTGARSTDAESHHYKSKR